MVMWLSVTNLQLVFVLNIQALVACEDTECGGINKCSQRTLWIGRLPA
jgi:hypothetical protein